MYYNGVNVINSGCPICFVLGSRSAGKSFYFKKNTIDRFFKYGEEFIYIRRYQNELEEVLPKYFDDVKNKYSDDISFYTGGSNFYCVKDGVTHTMGYHASLSKIGSLKSIGREKVTTIIFDEFIPFNGRYIKVNDPFYEPNLLLSMYLSVARGYNTPIRDNLKIILIANMDTYFNPYFTFFDINMMGKNKYKRDNIYCEIIENTEVNKLIEESKIGSILSKTKYGEYALHNIPMNDSFTRIRKHDNKSKKLFQVYIHRWYSIYYDYYGYLYIGFGYDETFLKTYKMIPLETEKEIPYLPDNLIKLLRVHAKEDKLYYETPEIKALLSGILYK